MCMRMNINAAEDVRGYNAEKRPAVRCHDSGRDPPERTLKETETHTFRGISLLKTVQISTPVIWGVYDMIRTQTVARSLRSHYGSQPEPSPAANDCMPRLD